MIVSRCVVHVASSHAHAFGHLGPAYSCLAMYLLRHAIWAACLFMVVRIAESVPPVAKITRPVHAALLPRKRLLRLLEQALKGQVVWLSGPAGAGKSTLVGNCIAAAKRRFLWYRVDEGDADVASFFHYLQLAADEYARRCRKRPVRLVPEHLLNPAAFAQRFFENLYGLLAPGTCLVFDNVHGVPADSPFHQVLADGLAGLPPGVHAILVSRGSPTAPYARFRVSNPKGWIGWKELRLTSAETEAIVRKRWGKKARPETIRYLHARSDGWIAGLVLLLEKTAARDLDTHRLSSHSPEEIFEYFGGEIFARLDQETRAFLMATAFLPDMTAQAAESLSGSPKAGAILAHLYNHGYFTEKHLGAEPVYRYHSLFREFLRHRAEETLPADALSAVRRRAASILEGSGRLEGAAALCVEGSDWGGLGRIVREHAPELHRQGRGQTLCEWLRALPGELRDGDPWHVYWMGVCRLPGDAGEAGRFFEKSFELFESAGNFEGALLAWTGTVDSILLEWDDFSRLDRCIDWLQGRLAQGVSFPSPETEAQVATRMLPAALFRRPGMPGLVEWAERAASLSRDSVDGDLKLQASIAAGMYYFWVGDRVRTTILVEDGRRLAAAEKTHPAVYISWTWVDAMANLCGGLDREAARIALAGGLKASRESGVHLWDHLLHGLSAIASLMDGDAKAAARTLKDMQPDAVPTRRQACAMYEYVCSWLHLLRGDTARAAAHAERALGHAKASGLILSLVTCRLAIANVAIERGRYAEAETRVAEAWEIIRGIGSLPLEYMAHLTEARILLARGNEPEALDALRSGMAIGREHGYLNTFWWWQPVAMARLCEKALAAGIETDYVRGLIVGNDLAAEAPPVELEDWPWPLRIYTLDRFGLVRRGESVLSPGKVQQKPLMMLKALIAMGGRGVPESELNDVLWPDVDGDLAHQSFATTLRRLRQLLGSDKSILMRDGRLTLNNRYCWVDAWAFERLIGRAETGRNDSANGDGPVRLVERAMALYRGPFLAGESFFSRLVSVRERLRNKFLRSVETAGRTCEEAGDLRRAIVFYEKGLEVDDLAEEFYRCLISCYRKSGMNAEALRVYRRCVKTLSSGLGVAPSRETQDLANSLITQ